MNQQGLSYPDVARVVGTGLISTGVGLLFFVLVTVAWGDPFTKLSEAGAQDTLEQEFRDSIGTDPAALQQDVRLDSRNTRGAARRLHRKLPTGAVAARMTIPRIGLRKYVVKGARVEDLKKGPGFYNETRFPGSGLPVAIAGHRTTHGAPFLHVDRLRPGDRITIDLPYGRFQYLVSKTRIISPRDWSIIDIGAAETNKRLARKMRSTGICPTGTCEHLVLTACHPKYSAAQRIAVFARLDRVSLRGAG